MAKRKRKSTVDSTTLDRFGRVLLPKSVRDRMGIRPGDSLALEVREGTVILRPAGEGTVGIVRVGGVPVLTGYRPAGDLDVGRLLRRIREDRDRRLGGGDRG